jgi:hypothetical protein
MVIPTRGYCDQPYIVKSDDGTWVCTLTTGPGNEGDVRQHVVAMITADRGRTWSDPIDIEPLGPPESSWVMPLKTPGGRIYAIYVHNTDDIREIDTPVERFRKRADTLGHYVYKFSDDGGRSWSPERYEIPMRKMQIDRDNVYGGEVLFFWGVGKPIIHDGAAYFGAAKVGGFGEGFMLRSEGIFLSSHNIVSDADPSKLRWETLPDGDHGVRAPKGPISEEHNLVALNDGSLYCTYRTVEGYMGQAYSRDGGHTWDDRQYATYTPGGRPIKHPRAAPFVWKSSNNRYLLWYHNHGGKDYVGRNPAWIAGGVERDGYIHWSQPEICLYDDDPSLGPSYPDFIEDGGKYFISETQKTTARVHQVENSLIEGLWSQHELKAVAQDGLVLDLGPEQCQARAEVPAPRLPEVSDGGGFSLDLWIVFDDVETNQIIVDTRDASGQGMALTTTPDATVQLVLYDSFPEEQPRLVHRTRAVGDCDPGLLKPGRLHHITVTVDGGPKIMTFVVDGVLCDGGTFRQFGWTRFRPDLGNVNGLQNMRVASALNGHISRLRVYERALRTSEAIGNWRTGP